MEEYYYTIREEDPYREPLYIVDDHADEVSSPSVENGYYLHETVPVVYTTEYVPERIVERVYPAERYQTTDSRLLHSGTVPSRRSRAGTSAYSAGIQERAATVRQAQATSIPISHAYSHGTVKVSSPQQLAQGQPLYTTVQHVSQPTKQISSGHHSHVHLLVPDHHESVHVVSPNRHAIDKLPSISEADVQRMDYVGCGTNASVFTCLYDGAMACEKVLTCEDTDAQLSEAMLMGAVDRHPNVLRLYGICRRANGETSLVLELMQTDLLHKLRQFRESPNFDLNRHLVQLLEYLIQAARGLRFLHRQGVVHRDIACRNMLISGNCLKIADFGLAKNKVQNFYSGDLPKPLSTAPEAIRDLDNPLVWSEKSDVWSFGLFVWEVISCGQDPLQEFHNSVPAFMSALSQGWHPAKLAQFPEQLWKLMMQCLSLETERRPTFEYILQQLTIIQMESAHQNHGARGQGARKYVGHEGEYVLLTQRVNGLVG